MPFRTSIFGRVVSFSQLRYASRVLFKSPGFALTSIVTLALGIGITSAIFSVVYGVLLKPAPYAHPEHLCLLWKSVPKKNLDRDWTSYPTYQDWKRNASSFDDRAAFLRPDGSTVNLTGADNVEQIQSTKVSGNFFSVLGTPALFGRTFTASEIARNPNLAVVSYEFWRQRFSLARDVVGRKLEIDGVSFEVIGVMPPVFAFPAKESQAWFPAKDTQMWLPINSDSRWGKFQRIRLADPFGVVARLRENTTNDQAQAEMSEIAGQLAREHPDTDRYLGVHVVPLAIYLVGSRVRLPAADRRGYRFAAEDIASIVQAPVVHVSDYAHYACRSPMGDRQRLPNRILIGEESVCEHAVNHHHLVGADSIGGHDKPALQQGNPHRLQIVGIDRRISVLTVRLPMRLVSCTLNVERPAAKEHRAPVRSRCIPR